MRKKHAYLVGIKGVAMAALAVYLTESGLQVSGSDMDEAFPTDDELKKISVHIYSGFDADRIGKLKPDIVYYTGAHGGRDNPEVAEAIRLGIPAYPHGKGLGKLAEGKRQIVVAGSHGKTTTSAMIATILLHANLDPSYAIGCGAISGLPAGHVGTSDWFVLEGDEYITDPGHDTTPRFLWLAPEILVVTNIDFDHPDAYRDLSDVQRAFSELQSRQTGMQLTVVNGDDAKSRTLLNGANVMTYGYSPNADVHISHMGFGDQRIFFTLEQKEVKIGEFAIKVPGRHNVANAAAAAVACHAIGVSWSQIHDGLLAFFGTKRRFEKIGERNGTVYYDDYAHHPAEIRATLAGARGMFPKHRIVAVFQPHTYSRTKALLSEFAAAFSDADTVILSAIYASKREHDTLGITGATLAEAAAKLHHKVIYAKEPEDIRTSLRSEVKPGDVVIFMGAGDIYSWGRDIAERL